MEVRHLSFVGRRVRIELLSTIGTRRLESVDEKSSWKKLPASCPIRHVWEGYPVCVNGELQEWAIIGVGQARRSRHPWRQTDPTLESVSLDGLVAAECGNSFRGRLPQCLLRFRVVTR